MVLRRNLSSSEKCAAFSINRVTENRTVEEYDRAPTLWQTNNNGVITGWTIRDPVAFAGPNTAGQGLVTDQIKMARFNLYLILNDGSWGAHNPQFALSLLDAAYYWVVQELFQ